MPDASQSTLTLGKPAPDFALPDQNGGIVRLADLHGCWVVLYFYPKDDTPGCTTEACEFTAALKDFESLHARVFGVSGDTEASHRAFIAKHGLDLDLLTDADHRVMAAYGAWGEKVRDGKTSVGVLRSTVLIDPEGRVAAHWAQVKPEGHAEKVRQRLAECRQGGYASEP